MNFKRLTFILFLILSCGSPPEIHYYMIDYSLEPISVKDAKHQVLLGIEKFRADPLYERDRIVYRSSLYEIKFYNYHCWITSPTEIVTQKAYELFHNSGLFKQVVLLPNISDIDYLLRGTINAFEEWDEGDEWYGHVKLQMELIKMEDKSLVWQGRFDKKVKTEEKKPIAVVRAVSASLQACIQEIIMEINQKLSHNN